MSSSISRVRVKCTLSMLTNLPSSRKSPRMPLPLKNQNRLCPNSLGRYQRPFCRKVVNILSGKVTIAYKLSKIVLVVAYQQKIVSIAQ